MRAQLARDLCKRGSGKPYVRIEEGHELELFREFASSVVACTAISAVLLSNEQADAVGHRGRSFGGRIVHYENSQVRLESMEIIEEAAERYMRSIGDDNDTDRVTGRVAHAVALRT
jgi:hypothetical protein